jgi:hypothetical protein
VPLSDREQRILEEIEKNLYQEDPVFARDVRRRAPKMEEIRRVKLGAATFVLGFVGLIAFFVLRVLILGVAAFGAMVAGLVLVAGSMRVLVPSRRSNGPGARDRLARNFGQWEQRFRERYKRP